MQPGLIVFFSVFYTLAAVVMGYMLVDVCVLSPRRRMREEIERVRAELKRLEERQERSVEHLRTLIDRSVKRLA